MPLNLKVRFKDLLWSRLQCIWSRQARTRTATTTAAAKQQKYQNNKQICSKINYSAKHSTAAPMKAGILVPSKACWQARPCLRHSWCGPRSHPSYRPCHQGVYGDFKSTANSALDVSSCTQAVTDKKHVILDSYSLNMPQWFVKLILSYCRDHVSSTRFLRLRFEHGLQQIYIYIVFSIAIEISRRWPWGTRFVEDAFQRCN